MILDTFPIERSDLTQANHAHHLPHFLDYDEFRYGQASQTRKVNEYQNDIITLEGASGPWAYRQRFGPYAGIVVVLTCWSGGGPGEETGAFYESERGGRLIREIGYDIQLCDERIVNGDLREQNSELSPREFQNWLFREKDIKPLDELPDNYVEAQKQTINV
jgi:hypothetical protein